jgi:hypothetical protein
MDDGLCDAPGGGPRALPDAFVPNSVGTTFLIQRGSRGHARQFRDAKDPVAGAAAGRC